MRSTGQRAGLSRDAVLDAAREVLGERGYAGVSMRAVATRLGVAPNALYSHVESKDALVDALLDDLLGGLAHPDPVGDPRAGLASLMTATYDLLVDHPDLVPLYLARQGSRGVHARALGASMTVLLGRAGVTGGGAAQLAVRVLVVHTIGFAAIAGEADTPLGPGELRRSFAAGLDWLLTGILA